MEEPIEISQLEDKIRTIELKHPNRFEAYNEIIILCTNVLADMRRKVWAQSFPNTQEEIAFFKNIKQIPLSNLIYYSEVRCFEARFPKGNPKAQKKYIQKKIKELNRFFAEQIDFEQYINLGLKHLDEHYFTRQKPNITSYQIQNDYFQDPFFNTSQDRLLGKLLANQRLLYYLQNRLEELKRGNADKISDLKWTSSKVSLTELVYALYHAKVIDNGSADIKQIANAFQRAFNYDLGDFYRTYTEIRLRKKNRVKFLKELSITMSNSMDDFDS